MKPVELQLGLPTFTAFPGAPAPDGGENGTEMPIKPATNPIYTPSGAALEYSPRALNHYQDIQDGDHGYGCDHRCGYCYRLSFNNRYNRTPTLPATPTPKPGLLEGLDRQLTRHPETEQVLLSFAGDPYCRVEPEVGFTREVLKVLLKHQVPVAILTKGGSRCLRDLDLFKQFKRIKVGATLTRRRDEDSLRDEPGAALPGDRLHALEVLHAEGIQTWASFEPVLDTGDALWLLEHSAIFVDGYKIGKLNHKRNDTDWGEWFRDAVTVMRGLDKRFYIKNGLAGYAPKGFVFRPGERDPNFMNV